MATLFLIGFMGSGKSTIGRQLANKLNYRFIDLDKFIEDENNLTISELFETKGENEFRIIERNALQSLISKENTIVACGGGTACYFNNIELMNSHGISIYIKMSPKMLADRLIDAKQARPLIKGKNKDELLIYIVSELEKREDFYHKAQYTIKGKSIDINELAHFLNDKI